MRRFAILFSTLFFLFACDEEVTSSANCGDGVIDPGEECDTILPDELSCLSMGYHGGTVSCNSDCTMNISLCIAEGRCGDGSVQGEYEGCEPGVSTEACSELGRGDGQAVCLETCQYDFSDCTLAPTCGDGVIIVEEGEECDGTNLGGNTCFDLNYYGGQLACNDDCTFDITQCALRGKCGDGTIQEIGAEECDGADLAGKTCEGLGFYTGGTLTCGDDCHYDTSGCEGMCGDQVVQSDHNETCDGSDLGGRTCATEGFQGGTLTCNSN